jgi:hypothetical protein
MTAGGAMFERREFLVGIGPQSNSATGLEEEVF